MNEIPERVDRHLTPEQTAQAEDLAEKRGISIDMAERAILGIRVEPSGPVTAPKSPRRRYSHRGGRSYPEKSGRDVSRELANQEAAEQPELSPEERQAVSRRGRAAVEAALDEEFGKDRHITALEAKVNAMIPIDPDDVAGSLAARERQLTALLRTHFEQKDNPGR
jgi:hypothetical protein